LTGGAAFHIRRLVAETFAEYAPYDDDRLLIRDLRMQNKDVFQVIYNHADKVAWHHFWMKKLVPLLKNLNDIEGLTTHAHRISQWKNEDALGVLSFWSEMLEMDGVDHERLAGSIAVQTTQFDVENMALCGPLVTKLLALPRQDYSFLGKALAYLVDFGSLDDEVLWDYIAGDISEEDAATFHFNQKLHCQPHEFGDRKKNFLASRMRASASLLDLAIASIEQWSNARSRRYGLPIEGFYVGFLSGTSHDDTHSQCDFRHTDNERVLFDAVESAILHHAINRSCWWIANRERLGFNSEGALRYFALLGSTEASSDNLDLITQMLTDGEWFEVSLSYEIGSLIERSLIQLDGVSQNHIQSTLLSLHDESSPSSRLRAWRPIELSQLILGIPCHLRCQEAQNLIDECETLCWPLERVPRIVSRGGVVHAPFSFKEFLNVSDAGVLRLLAHYDGYENSFDEFLVGGEREVAWQLREAATRHPSRFLNLLSENWQSIPPSFRDNLMEGLGVYLLYRYGDLQPNGDWSSVEVPDPIVLAGKIIDELEEQPEYWHHNRAAAKVIEGCAFVVADGNDSGRLVYLATEFSSLEEESSVSEDQADLITAGINMSRGHIANALMVLAIQHEKKAIAWPDPLSDSLRRFSNDQNPAVRSVLLRRMPYLQSLRPVFGWELFWIVMEEPAPGLWGVAEPCLYHAYRDVFNDVDLCLDILSKKGEGKDLETWGRISALAAFSGKVNFSSLLINLNTLKSAEAWSGAASVWSHPGNFLRHREQCLTGLEKGLNPENQFAPVVARELRSFLQTDDLQDTLPVHIFKNLFPLLESGSESGRSDIFGIDKWLNTVSLLDPFYALEVAELYFEFARRTKAYLFDHEGCLTQLLTRLFAHAEELEESDGGKMLHRVVLVQDLLLVIGVSSMDDWLKAAERSLSQ
jgi:hypothetical protein